MRRIDIGGLGIAEDWKERAQRAREAVAAAAPKDRPTLISEHSRLWGELKEALAQLSHQKCWYCETQRVRDDCAVDHFRPKSARCTDDHHGYWWLAFEPSNFRFSCRHCNERRRDQETNAVGGKGSAFPLLPGGRRACAPGACLDDERCALLDPVRAGDAELIGFTDDGEAVAEADPDLEPEEVVRAATSIELYHLNHSLLRLARAQTALRLKSLLEQVREAAERCTRRREQGEFMAADEAKHEMTERLQEVRQLKQADQEYSSLVVAVLRAKQSASTPWIRRLLA
jgi:5-methylcytosine-specific restriction endonuclease McrA